MGIIIMKKLSILASILALLINFSAVAASEDTIHPFETPPFGRCTTTEGVAITIQSNCTGEWEQK